MTSSVVQGCDPLACARSVQREFISLNQLSNHPPSAVRIGVSSALMGLLAESGSEGTFAAELSDVIGSIAGVPVQVDLTEAPHLPPHGALVTTLSDGEIGDGREPEDSLSLSSERPARARGQAVSNTSIQGIQTLELIIEDRRYPITGRLSLGRSSSCDISIDDSEISRRHAEVTNQEGTLILRDLGSTNGTRVNGRFIDAPIALTVGDVIQIGNTEISVVSS